MLPRIEDGAAKPLGPEGVCSIGSLVPLSTYIITDSRLNVNRFGFIDCIYLVRFRYPLSGSVPPLL